MANPQPQMPRPRKRHTPLVILSAGVLMTVAAALLIGWNSWETYRSHQEILNQNLRLDELTITLLEADEALTTSARTAAATGDLHWEEVHRRNATVLDAAIAEMGKLLASQATFEAMLDDNNQRLLKMEARALALVRDGQREAAMSLLLSDDYESAKQAFSARIRSLVAQARAGVEVRFRAHEQRALVGAVLAGICLLTLTAGWIGTVLLTRRDIAQRRQAEQYHLDLLFRAQASEARYRRLIEASEDIIYTLSPDSILLSLNPAFERITGWPREEWLGKSFHPLVHPEDIPLAEQVVQEALDGRSVPRLEYRVRRRDGAFVVLEVSVAPDLRDGQLRGLWGVARDVTDRRAMEDQLRQSQKLEAVARLAGGVAHDFNNLLGVILGRAELLEETLGPGDPRQVHTQEIQRGCDRAVTLTRQLLAFGGRHRAVSARLQVNEVLEAMESVLAGLAGEQVRIVWDLDSHLGWVMADRGQVEQVITSLVSNASEAMPAGGCLTLRTANAELDTRAASRLGLPGPGKFVLLTVSDTGVGMDEEIQAHLFEPFFTTKKTQKGAGLGLASARGLVEKSGGLLRFESRPGQGSTFYVYLPLETQESPVSTTPPV